MSQVEVKIPRQFEGEVVSTKMTDTIVVLVSRRISHPTYGKKITRSQKFKVHSPKNTFQVGDQVCFEECRPISRDKRWRIVAKV